MKIPNKAVSGAGAVSCCSVFSCCPGPSISGAVASGRRAGHRRHRAQRRRGHGRGRCEVRRRRRALHSAGRSAPLVLFAANLLAAYVTHRAAGTSALHRLAPALEELGRPAPTFPWASASARPSRSISRTGTYRRLKPVDAHQFVRNRSPRADPPRPDLAHGQLRVARAEAAFTSSSASSIPGRVRGTTARRPSAAEIAPKSHRC